MCLEFALKKGGLGIIRNFLHSTQGVVTALPANTRNRYRIGYNLKDYRNGKLVASQYVSTLEEAFPAKGDKK